MLQPLSAFGLPSGVLVWQAAFLAALSLGVGVLGGAVGLALGTMRLPFMLLLGMSPATGGGTNILVSTLSAATGAYRHLREQRVDWTAVLVQGAPATAGALAGGLLSSRVSEPVLVGLAGVLVVWQGVELALRAQRYKLTSGPARPVQMSGAQALWTPGRIALESAVGLVIGALGSAVGLILGSLRLPALIVILKMDPRVAAGTNLVIGAVMGAFGWAGHAAGGQVDYPLLVLMGLTGMIGTYYGARWTRTMGLRRLLFLMAAVLLAVGGLLLVDAARRAA